MADYGVLKELERMLASYTQESISKSISKELAAYRMGREDVAADVLAYEAILRNKYEKKEIDIKKALEKKRLEEESAYATKLEERTVAKRKLIATQIEDLKDERVKLREETSTVLQKNRLALEEASNKKSSEALEKASKAMAHNYELLASVPSKIMDTMTKGVNEYMGAFSKYFTAIEVGLLGTGRSYDSAKSMIDRVVGLNPVVRQTEVLERLEEYIKSGVIRDAELRATLSTIGTKITNTFNSLDPTLLSLTKILKEDTTIARLGMETALTRYMAGEYEDTTYFADNTNEYVSAQLLQAMSQMGRDQGLALEYSVQKWLGSFVSVGVSEETAKKIADGIGYLTSGNIEGLTSNTSLLNLLLGAANNGGVDIASILQNGANASTIDKLMQGLYAQMLDIEASDNQVVKSQYANLYGMSISDITAMNNLTQAQVDANLTENLGASDMAKLTEQELKSAISRVATSTLIENAIDNVMSIVGENIASNAGMSIMWQLADMVTQAGGISVPGVLALGTGLSQIPDVDQIAKLGLLTGSVLGSIGDVIASLNSNGEFDFSKFTNDSDVQSISSVEQATLGQLQAEVASVSNTGAMFLGDTSESNIFSSSMAQVKDLISLTGQNEELEEKAATSGDIDRLIQTIEEEGKKNRGEYTIQNNGPLATVRWG
jgi:hypothetical protein